MSTRFLRTLTLLAVLTSLAASVSAQTTVNSTTLSAAMNSTVTIIPLTSTSTVAVGDDILVDAEFMRVLSLSPTRVRRGAESSVAVAHANTAVAWTGVRSRFYQSDPSPGPCTATNELFLPHIVFPKAQSQDVNIFDCLNSEWTSLAVNGWREYHPGRTDGGTTYTASGAIVVQPGLSFIGTGGALAMTLVNPTQQQNGMIMIITASTAQAHTVTNTTGFGGGAGARDVATFGGAINDSMSIIAFNGVWWLISTRNVTLS